MSMIDKQCLSLRAKRLARTSRQSSGLTFNSTCNSSGTRSPQAANPRQANRDGHLESGEVFKFTPESRRGVNPSPRIHEACFIDHTMQDVVVRSAANFASSATAAAICGRSK